MRRKNWLHVSRGKGTGSIVSREGRTWCTHLVAANNCFKPLMQNRVWFGNQLNFGKWRNATQSFIMLHVQKQQYCNIEIQPGCFFSQELWNSEWSPQIELRLLDFFFPSHNLWACTIYNFFTDLWKIKDGFTRAGVSIYWIDMLKKTVPM